MLERAWVRSDEGIEYFAEAPRARQGCASTAVSELVQGVFEKLRDRSFFVLRRPIYFSGRATPLCRGIVKVAAKRLVDEADWTAGAKLGCGLDVRSGARPHDGFGAEPPVRVERVAGPAPSEAWTATAEVLRLWPASGSAVTPPSSDSDFLRLAARLASQVERGTTLHLYDRNIAALIASSTGEILSWATNSNSLNKTRHAEMNAVQALRARFGRGLPPGSVVYSTLKPCRMCAGAIWLAAEEPASIRVVYQEEDEGALARGTVLDLGSAERKRAARNAAELAAALLLKAGAPAR